MYPALDSQICHIESDYNRVFLQDGTFFSFVNQRKSLLIIFF